LVQGVSLAPGAELEFRGTAPRRIGRAVHFRIRRDTWPVLSVECTRPASHHTIACPDRG
jgi:hypothetical protein